MTRESIVVRSYQHLWKGEEENLGATLQKQLDRSVRVR
jgi:hypothetical protein